MSLLTLSEGAAAATPATGKVNIYAKTDGKIYSKDDAGIETELGNVDIAAEIQGQTATAFTTGGTSTAYTLTPTPALSALTANQRFRVTFHTAAGTTPTLAISGLTAKSLKYKDGTGTKQAVTSTQIPSGWVADVEYDGTDYVLLNVPSANDIASLTEDTTPDGAADYLMTYDASASALKKILLEKATAFKGVSFTRDMSTASGSQAVTGVGFKPKAILFFAGHASGSAYIGSWGYATASEAGCVGSYAAVAANAFVASTYCVEITQSATGIYRGALASMDSDGFTINWTKINSPISTVTIKALCLR